MDPKLVSMNNYDDTLEFTLEEIELSFANAIRRTILSDIPIVCFKTYPEKENQCNILINTTKHNNEIVKHISSISFPYLVGTLVKIEAIRIQPNLLRQCEVQAGRRQKGYH